MNNIKKITVTLFNDETLEFLPKNNTQISVRKGIKCTMNVHPNSSFTIEHDRNGKEVLLIIDAPEDIKNEITSAVDEILNKMINN
jgi:hypothetical protein